MQHQVQIYHPPLGAQIPAIASRRFCRNQNIGFCDNNAPGGVHLAGTLVFTKRAELEFNLDLPGPSNDGGAPAPSKMP